MKKKIIFLIFAVLILTGAWQLWQFCAYPYTYDELPIVWQEETTAFTDPPTGADQLCVFLGDDLSDFPQTAIRFGNEVMDLLRSCRYQKRTDPPEDYSPDSSQWCGGYEIILVAGDTQARLYWDTNFWIPTSEGWQAYSLSKNPKQQLISLQIEYHNNVIPALDNTI